jgi:hypothetical protein
MEVKSEVTCQPLPNSTPANGEPGQPPRRAVRRLAGDGYRFLRGGLISVLAAVASSPRIARNLVRWLLNRSDYRRWSNLDNYESWWDTRTQKIAHLIPPGSRVIEFGAGRRQLEKILDPSCSYVPSDLVDRGGSTLVCDLNARPLPDLGRLGVDTAVFGGVLEYVSDVESLAGWLSSHVSQCVVSYACDARRAGIVRRIADRLDRSYYGYMNSYREEELVHIFQRAGFRCQVRESWTNQRLFLFVSETQRVS